MTDTQLGLASIGVLATSAVFWTRALQGVAIPKDRGFFVAAWLCAAALGLTALFGDPGWLGGIPASISVFAALFFLATVAIGRQKVGDGAIALGATIPHFTAPDEHGVDFDSQSLAGQPVLIKFFRGHW
jgi:hypothetical protein